MVNIIFARAIYLMHILVIKPVILLEDSITCLGYCECQKAMFWSVSVVNILDCSLNLRYFGLKLIK